jgi:lipoteichoic acid synthase
MASRSHPSESPDGRAVILEAGPIVLAVAALCVKLLYFSVVGDPIVGWFYDIGWLRRTALVTVESGGSLLLLFSPLLLVTRRRRLAILWAGSLAITFLIYADVLYLRYFGDVLSVAALTGVRQIGMIQGSILALMKPSDALLFVDLVLLPLLLRRPLLSTPAPSPSRLRPLAWSMLATGALLSALPLTTILRKGEYDYFKLRGVAKIGLLNYHAYDVSRQLYLGATTPPIGPAERERVSEFFQRSRSTGAPVSDLFGVARRRNLIMVMVESLQAFPLGLVVNGKEVTPHLNRLARRSITFDHFYDQTWHGVTSDGEFTSLQSLHPLPDGGVPTRYGDHHFFALPSVLDANGYSTVSAHGFSGAIWMMATAHRNYGFERSYFSETFDQAERIGMGLSDASFFRQMLPRLTGEHQPFMAYLVTLSTHFPFRLPPDLADSSLGVPAGTLVGAYLQSVHQFDKALGEFLAGLEDRGLLDRSVLVLYGDHGAFGDEAALGALLSRYAGYPERRPGFDFRYWQVEKQLPLIIHLPHDAAAGVRSGSGGDLDIAPTVMALLGISNPHMVTMGRDLTTGGNSFVVFRDGSFVVGDTACVVPSASVRAVQCRQLGTGRELIPEALRGRFQEARARLAVSDILLSGDLIPWASQLDPRAAPGSDTLSLTDTTLGHLSRNSARH